MGGAARDASAGLDEPLTTTSRRATAMPPAERRAAIVAATLPLMLAQGTAITTRQIAEAAGIAEGTIFRAFPDKEALVQAVIDAAVDPSPVERALAAIDPALPFEARLEAAVRILQRRLREIWHLLAVTGREGTSGTAKPQRPAELVELTRLFAGERSVIRHSPEVAAQLLRGITLALTHPALAPEPSMSPAEIVSLFLDGVRARPATRRRSPRPC